MISFKGIHIILNLLKSYNFYSKKDIFKNNDLCWNMIDITYRISLLIIITLCQYSDDYRRITELFKLLLQMEKQAFMPELDTIISGERGVTRFIQVLPDKSCFT